MPPDRMYLPAQAGAALHEALPYQGDDGGENISARNANYCELTCLYWAWKNVRAEYIGLCHYRRYFAGKRFGTRVQRILTYQQAEKRMEQTPVLLPKPRNYWIETNYTQYIHAHHAADLDTTRQILQERWPDYLPAYDVWMQKTVGHRFNMLVMRHDLLDRYCSWLFDVLFELENRLDISSYNAYDARVFGFVAERLLDVWLETNKIDYQETAVVNIESQHWLHKCMVFLKRKAAAKHRA